MWTSFSHAMPTALDQHLSSHLPILVNAVNSVTLTTANSLSMLTSSTGTHSTTSIASSGGSSTSSILGSSFSIPAFVPQRNRTLSQSRKALQSPRSEHSTRKIHQMLRLFPQDVQLRHRMHQDIFCCGMEASCKPCQAPRSLCSCLLRQQEVISGSLLHA